MLGASPPILFFSPRPCGIMISPCLRCVRRSHLADASTLIVNNIFAAGDLRLGRPFGGVHRTTSPAAFCATAHHQSVQPAHEQTHAGAQCCRQHGQREPTCADSVSSVGDAELYRAPQGVYSSATAMEERLMYTNRMLERHQQLPIIPEPGDGHIRSTRRHRPSVAYVEPTRARVTARGPTSCCHCPCRVRPPACSAQTNRPGRTVFQCCVPIV